MEFKLFYGKKGAERNILNALLGSALAVMAIFLLLYVGGKLLGLFVNTQEYDATINNLNEISLQIEKMLKENNNEIETPYYIDSDFMLAGFGFSEGRIMTTCGNKEIRKPNSCESNACLCIFESETPVKCIPFTDKIKPAALESGSENAFFGYKIEGTNYEDLALYGNNCPSWYHVFKGDW